MRHRHRRSPQHPFQGGECGWLRLRAVAEFADNWLMSAHVRNDRYSLLLHKEAARALAQDERLLDRARAILINWKLRNASAPADWDEWLRILDQGPTAVVQVMLQEDERSMRLRQSSPFSVLVPARRRWALLKEARREPISA